MTEKKISIQKYAMQFGTMLGIFWIGKFIFFPLGMKFQFFVFAFMVLTIAVPFIGYRYVRTFRDNILGGYISFTHAWAFSVFMYIFAGLLVAVAHYIYFQFIDHGFILETYLGQLEEMKRTGGEELNIYINSLEESLNIIGNLSPIELTLQLFYMNVIAGGFLSLPTALFAARKDKNDASTFKPH